MPEKYCVLFACLGAFHLGTVSYRAPPTGECLLFVLLSINLLFVDTDKVTPAATKGEKLYVPKCCWIELFGLLPTKVNSVLMKNGILKLRLGGMDGYTVSFGFSFPWLPLMKEQRIFFLLLGEVDRYPSFLVYLKYRLVSNRILGSLRTKNPSMEDVAYPKLISVTFTLHGDKTKFSALLNRNEAQN